MKHLLERVIWETDKTKKQVVLNLVKKTVVKSKRFDGVRLFFTMLFGQATILISIFTALSFLFTEEDWVLFDKVPFIKRILMELSSISSLWYLEAFIIIMFAFALPCVIGWVIALPTKILPVKTETIHPEAADYAKKIYHQAQKIKQHIDQNEMNGGGVIMFISSCLCAIGAAAALIYSEMYSSGELVLNNLFGVLIGAAFLIAVVWGIMYGLNFLLIIIADITTRNYEEETKLLSQACVVYENEWLKQDKSERGRRELEQAEKNKQKQLELHRQKEEKEKQDQLKAEAAIWAYQNNYTPNIYDNTSSTLSMDDHDDLDSLTEAMGFEVDVSDM